MISICSNFQLFIRNIFWYLIHIIKVWTKWRRVVSFVLVVPERSVPGTCDVRPVPPVLRLLRQLRRHPRLLAVDHVPQLHPVRLRGHGPGHLQLWSWEAQVLSGTGSIFLFMGESTCTRNCARTETTLSEWLFSILSLWLSKNGLTVFSKQFETLKPLPIQVLFSILILFVLG